MKTQGTQLYLKPEEALFLSMSVLSTIDLLEEQSKDVRINWNPEARKQIREMLSAGNSLKTKLQKLGFDMNELPPYMDGDEKEFLTQQS